LENKFSEEAEPIDAVAIDSGENPEVLFWRISGLWESSRELPVEMVPLDYFVRSLGEPQPDWYEGDAPTVCDFMRHAKRIYEADLSQPVIISAEGYLMDGKHRVAKAALLGMKEIAAVRFQQNPEPDWRRPRLDNRQCDKNHSD
jgi:hypothetical protein